jgi:hypothetical protein
MTIFHSLSILKTSLSSLYTVKTNWVLLGIGGGGGCDDGSGFVCVCDDCVCTGTTAVLSKEKKFSKTTACACRLHQGRL